MVIQYLLFNSLIVIHFVFSYLSFAVLEKNMVTDDSRMMTLGVMKMRVRVRSLQSVHLYTISDTHDSRKSFSGEGGRSSRTAPNCLTRILLRVS